MECCHGDKPQVDRYGKVLIVVFIVTERTGKGDSGQAHEVQIQHGFGGPSRTMSQMETGRRTDFTENDFCWLLHVLEALPSTALRKPVKRQLNREELGTEITDIYEKLRNIFNDTSLSETKLTFCAVVPPIVCLTALT